MINENFTEHKIYLMHQNDKVALLKCFISNFSLIFSDIIEIYNYELLPLYVKENKHINNWYEYRCFSNDIDGYNRIIHRLCGVSDSTTNRIYGAQTGISLFSYGANLTDKYWLNPIEPITFYSDIEDKSDLDEQIIFPSTYEKINFFTNPNISKNFGIMFLQHYNFDIKITDFRTPDICTDGNSKKRWLFIDNKYILQKISHYNDQRITFLNFMKENHPDIIPEFVVKEIFIDGYAVKQSVIESQCITSLNTELISAYDIICSNPKNGSSLWEIFEKNFLTLGNIEQHRQLINALKHYSDSDLSKIHHFDNFGFLRDSNTKEIIKPVIWSLP